MPRFKWESGKDYTARSGGLSEYEKWKQSVSSVDTRRQDGSLSDPRRMDPGLVNIAQAPRLPKYVKREPKPLGGKVGIEWKDVPMLARAIEHSDAPLWQKILVSPATTFIKAAETVAKPAVLTQVKSQYDEVNERYKGKFEDLEGQKSSLPEKNYIARLTVLTKNYNEEREVLDNILDEQTAGLVDKEGEVDVTRVIGRTAEDVADVYLEASGIGSIKRGAKAISKRAGKEVIEEAPKTFKRLAMERSGQFGTGAGIGSGGRAAQEEDATLKSVATATAGGTVVGIALGVGFAGLEKGASKIAKARVNKIIKQQDELSKIRREFASKKGLKTREITANKKKISELESVIKKSKRELRDFITKERGIKSGEVDTSSREAMKVVRDVSKTKKAIILNTKKVSKLKDAVDSLSVERGLLNIEGAAAEVSKPQTALAKFLSKRKTLRKVTMEATNAIEGGGGVPGRKMANRMRLQDFVGSRYKSEGEQVLRGLKALNKKYGKGTSDDVLEAIEKGRTSSLNGEQKKMANAVSGLFGKRLDDMNSAGAKIEGIKNYFPRMIDPGKQEAAVSWLEANGRRKDAKILKEMFERGIRPKKASSEFHRAIEKLPDEFYIKNRMSLFGEWNKQTSDRLAEMQIWGPNVEQLQKNIAEISGVDKSLAEYAQKIYNIQRFGIKSSSEVSNIFRVLRSAQVVTKMPLSTISNATQSMNTAIKGGVKQTTKAIAKFAKKEGREEMTQKALDAGINVHYLTDDLSEAVYRSRTDNIVTKAAEKMLKWNGFSGVEKFNRVVATETGEGYIKRIAKNPTKNAKRLTELGINPNKIKDGIVPKDDMMKGIREFVGQTQFFTGAKDLPSFATTTEFGKTLTHLGKFSIKQSQFLKDNVVKEVARGNIAPMIRLLTVGTAAGEMASAVRNTITGRKREYSWGEILEKLSDKELNEAFSMAAVRLDENIERAGGYGYGIEQIQSTKFADDPTEKIAKMSGPVFSDAYDLITTLMSLGIAYGEGDESGKKYQAGQLLKFGVRNVPLADPAITGAKRAGVDIKGVPAVGETLDVVGTPYDPRSSKYWDIRKKTNTYNVDRDQINEATRVEREGGNLSETELFKKLIKKAKNKNTSDKNREAIKEFLKSRGISI